MLKIMADSEVETLRGIIDKLEGNERKIGKLEAGVQGQWCVIDSCNIASILTLFWPCSMLTFDSWSNPSAARE